MRWLALMVLLVVVFATGAMFSGGHDAQTSPPNLRARVARLEGRVARLERDTARLRAVVCTNLPIC